MMAARSVWRWVAVAVVVVLAVVLYRHFELGRLLTLD